MPLYKDPEDTQLYEVIKTQTCSGRPLEVTTTSGNLVQITPAGTTASDAFGRLRVSEPLTLFDSSHRYGIDGKWNTFSGVSGTVVYNANEGLVDINVGTASGSKVYRETSRVFSYQPGKSLLVLATFVMASGQTNRRQRVGYFSSGNGIYTQLSGNTLSFVERSSVSGTVSETIVPQTSWNGDKMDGTGKSGITLDPTKAQILWMDIEWLGVGDVRVGYVMDGQFILCHTFKHPNRINSTYITTASLPLRYEIENLGPTDASGTLKQICSTVISEGGYQLEGRQYSVGNALNSPRICTNSGVFYPVASIRLKSSPDRLDAIAIPTNVNLVGEGNNAVFNWRLIINATTSGGSWASVESGSAVEYNLSGTSVSGGTVVSAGFILSTTQGATALDLPRGALFKYQLERDSFTNTPKEVVFAVAAKSDNDKVYATLDWEEITE